MRLNEITERTLHYPFMRFWLLINRMRISIYKDPVHPVHPVKKKPEFGAVAG